MRVLFPAFALLVLLTAACSGGADNPPASPTPAPSADTAGRTPNEPARTGEPTPGPSRRTPTPGPSTPSPGAPLYIALGDSLSYGEGASDRFTTAFVPLVHGALPPGTGLLNLGHSGDDSFEITGHGHLDQAVTEIARRNSDTDPVNDVTLVTLEIGGNDLLDLFFGYVVPGKCPTIVESLQRPECVGILEDTLGNYGPNLEDILDRLQGADPDLNIVLMTLYNPFSGAFDSLDPFGELSLEGMPDTPFPEGLNDIIRQKAQEHGVRLAEVYPEFVGKGKEYIAQDIIHPNDTGYRVMADAVIAAMNE